MKDFYVMNLDDAEDFFERCLTREAVTLKEKQSILEELVLERGLRGGDLAEEERSLIQRALDQNKGATGFKSNRVDDSNGNVA